MTTIEPNPTTTDATSAAAPKSDDATKAFSTSVLISAIRCTLTYVVFPWLLPLFGAASGIGPRIGLAVGAIAIYFNIASIRRFHKADHAWKWWISALNVGVIVLLLVLGYQDLTEVLR